jgi:predicted DNA-binding transcriptional regulator AlpA
MSAGTTLYRAFDVDGRLLYVGVSWNALHRLAQHRRIVGWWNAATRVELEHFGSRVEAEAAELHAIRAESPAFNVVGLEPLARDKVTLTLPYVGLTEIAAMLGVSRQRIYQLAKTEDFPAPVVELSITRVWSRDDVEAWARATGRL